MAVAFSIPLEGGENIRDAISQYKIHYDNNMQKNQRQNQKDWAEVIDFTLIRENGIPINELILRLETYSQDEKEHYES